MAAKIPVTRVVLERLRDDATATCSSLSEADAMLSRWAWDGYEQESSAGGDPVACVVSWADGTRLVVSYDLRAGASSGPANLGAAIHAQCLYSSGQARPPAMDDADYRRLIVRAGKGTVERYERMLDTLEM